MFSENDDDDFSCPSSSSKLASLFESSMTLPINSNQSLTYTAPKQPRLIGDEIKNCSPSNTQSSVISVKPVNVMKVVNGKHENLGKFGLALIGSNILKTYEIILYRDKQNVMTRLKVNDNFIFTLEKNNLAVFCDDQNQSWSVQFENAESSDVFASALDKHGAKVISNVKNTIPASNTKVNLDDANIDSDDSQVRASILSRMAKMGQQILPATIIKSNSSDKSDSDPDNVSNSNKKSVKKVRKNHNCAMTVNTQLIPTKNVTNPQLQTVLASNSDPVSLLLIENHNHNKEIHLNLMQISTKLEQVLNQIQVNTGGNKINDCTEKSKIKVLELRIANLCKELTEAKESTSNDDSLTLAQSELIKEQTKIIEELKDKITQQNKHEDENQEKISELNEIIRNQMTKLQQSEIRMEGDRKIIEDLNALVENLKQKLNEIEKCPNKDITNQINKNNFIEKLKQIMNIMFQNITENLSDESIVTEISHTKKVLAQNIKMTTYKIIEEFQNSFEDSSLEKVNCDKSVEFSL